MGNDALQTSVSTVFTFFYWIVIIYLYQFSFLNFADKIDDYNYFSLEIVLKPGFYIVIMSLWSLMHLKHLFLVYMSLCVFTYFICLDEKV